MLRTLQTVILIICIAPLSEAGTITGKVTLRGARDSRDVVVYIERIPGKTFTPPAEPVRLDQRSFMFVPHVLPILAGTRVAFPNSDEIRHNVYSPFPPEKFTLGTYLSGTTMFHTFSKSGIVTLLCNVHAEMSAFVIITETPYVAVTDNQGNYSIPNVPAGTYSLTTWYEQLKPGQSGPTRSIQVGETGLFVADFDIKK